MLDLIFLAAIIGFFLAAFAYVTGCDQLNNNNSTGAKQ